MDCSDITSYHAHIYFRDEAERGRARDLREQIAARFCVQMGRWHDKPVGPHAAGMYQVAFEVALFARFVPWLMLNRQDLVVFLHPNTLMPRRDHETHAVWMGDRLPLCNLEQLDEKIEPNQREVVVPNVGPGVKWP
ncbi:DOPA 4,5-dioxygenase family protein [Acidocella sp.]|uniref:DOPA 4,5-dioxygenase family protein n=1 Tax=Acidocella sp. TaxID=50710 RepID=UPI00260264B5|nr:DOPA 4,5-dioxygenase family protein [Acidocella sp.]